MTEAPSPPMLDHALAAARRGIRVIPIPANSKAPDLPKWQEKATTDEAQIRRWAEEHPGCNWGGLTGCILDFDVKHRKRGAEMFELFQMLFPGTYTQRSASGGYHMFFRPPEGAPPISNATGKLLAKFGKDCGIDVRGAAGQVVLAGSVVDGKAYEVVDDLPIAEAPEDLLALCGKERRKEGVGTADGILADHPADIARAVELLRKAEPAVEGQGGDQATYDLACEVRDRGVSELTALQLMLEHWNERCEPVWEVEDLARKVCNAYRYARDAAGNASVAADFGAPDPEAQERVEAQEGRGVQPHIVFERIKDLRTLPPTKWLIHRWVPEGGIGIFYGKWASGKSFILMDLGLHLAHGLQTWHGARLPGKPCDVLILAREGHQGFVKRVDAFKRKHGILDDAERLTFMRTSVSLMRTADFNALCHAIRNDGRRFKLVVIDTIARAMPGADMNEQQNVTQLMERCQQLGELTGAAVIGVHHQNKGGSMLGSVFFEANSDFVFEVTRTGAETGPLSAGEILCTKMKDGEDRWRKSVAYERIQLPIADIEDGDASSLAVASISDVATASAGPLIEETVAAALARKMLDGEASRTMPFNKLIQEMSAAEREAVGADVGDHKSRKLIEAFDGETERVTNFGILTLNSGKGHGRGGAVVTLRRSANGLSH